MGAIEKIGRRFYSEKNIKKILTETMGNYAKDPDAKKLINRISKDAVTAYKIGYKEGVAGKPCPKKDDIKIYVERHGTKHRDIIEAICCYMYDVAVAGWTMGEQERMIREG